MIRLNKERCKLPECLKELGAVPRQRNGNYHVEFDKTHLYDCERLLEVNKAGLSRNHH